MIAVRFHRRGGPEVLRVEDVPEVEPGPGAVRVRVRAVALNRLDVHVRRGLPIRMEMPHIGGSDFAGEVDAVGEGVTRAAEGDRVVGYPLLAYGDTPFWRAPGEARGEPIILGEQVNGACCEALVLPAENVVAMPDGLTFEQAAAVPVVFLTAWTMLVERARLQRGEVLLVLGAGSGVGTAAVQIGRHLGAVVIACTTGAARREGVVALGADHVVDYAHESIRRRVHEITGRAGADVVFEHVGPATWEESIASASYRGRIVTCGATTGRRAPTDLPTVFAKQLTIHGVTLGSRESLERMLGLFQRGALRPVIDRVLPLQECRRGHELLEAGGLFGKLVLRVGPGALEAAREGPRDPG